MAKRAALWIVGIVLICFVALTVLFWNELRSLASIRRVDEYGMFQMTYYGDYGFDDFLKIGASSDRDIEDFVIGRLLRGVPIDLNVTGGGCTGFGTRSAEGDVIMGRNFDFTYSPSMQIVTRPANGYASVSTANLAFAGYSREHLPGGLSFDSFLTLAAPFLPFDGMNEKGLAIALLAVPEADGGFDPDKITLNTTTAIRLVLDKAATVDEATQLLSQYNIYFSGGIDCHFLLGDAGGSSALVEYYDGAMRVVQPEEDYQIASNFIAFDGLNIGEGYDEFKRYDAVKAAIESNGGVLDEAQAVPLLAEVGVVSADGEDKSEWSVVYNLTDLTGTIFADRSTDHLIRFELTPRD